MFSASKRMKQVQSPMIPVVAEWIRAHSGHHLARPGGGPLWTTARGGPAGCQYLARDGADDHKYKLVSGIDELQERITLKLKSENQIDVQPGSRLVVTAGGNMAFFNAMAAIADPGDEIVLPAPYYFNHEMAVAMFNCRAVIVPTGPDYELDVEAIGRAISPPPRPWSPFHPTIPAGRSMHEFVGGRQ